MCMCVCVCTACARHESILSVHSVSSRLRFSFCQTSGLELTRFVQTDLRQIQFLRSGWTDLNQIFQSHVQLLVIEFC